MDNHPCNGCSSEEEPVRETLNMALIYKDYKLVKLVMRHIPSVPFCTQQILTVAAIVETERIDLNDQQSRGLFESAKNGRIDMVKYFIENGTHSFRSALSFAIEYEHLDVIKLLAYHDARLP